MKNIIFPILTLFLVCGCSSIPQPERKPVTYGIMDDNIPKSPLDKVQGGHEKNLAILLSENTKNFIAYRKKWIEEYEKDLNSLFAPTNHILALKEQSNPEFPSKYIIGKLKNNFGKLSLLPNISSLKKDYDALAIIDIYENTQGLFGSSKYIYEITTAFFTKNKEYITSAKSRISKDIPWNYNNSMDHEIEAHNLLVKSLDIWNSELQNSIEMSK